MALTAQSIVQRVVGMLQDTTSIRWPVNELVRWLNDGQREVVAYRPDSMNTTATMTLSAGTRQSLSSATANASGSAPLTVTPAKLLEISRNMAGTLAQARTSLEERLNVPVETIDPTKFAALNDRIGVTPDLMDILAPLAGILMRTRHEAVSA